jgi:hypothetical protein
MGKIACVYRRKPEDIHDHILHSEPWQNQSEDHRNPGT